jgi:hypothetical protein
MKSRFELYVESKFIEEVFGIATEVKKLGEKLNKVTHDYLTGRYDFEDEYGSPDVYRDDDDLPF